MYRLPLFLFLLLLYSSQSSGQSSPVVFFEQDFTTNNSKIPFGEKILLKSRYPDPLLDSLAITIYSKLDSQVLAVNTVDGKWNALAGPFDQKQTLIIKFKARKKIGKKEWDEISEKFIQKFNADVEAIYDGSGKGYDSARLSSLIRQQSIKNIPEYFKNFKNKKGVNAYDIFSEKIKNLPTPVIISLYNTSSECVKRKEEIIGLANEVNAALNVEKAKNSQSAMPEITVLPKLLKVDSLFDIKTVTTDSAILKKIDILKKKLSEYESLFDHVSTSIKKDFLPTLTEVHDYEHLTSFESDLDVSGITRYIGFDMGELFYQRETASYGTFILISPFARATEPDEEVSVLNLFNKSNCKVKVFDVINPTLGMAIANIPKPEENAIVWFAGGSVRFNKWVRFVIGDAFTVQNAKFRHHLSLGASINFLRLGDFLKVVGGGASYFQNKSE